MENFMDYIQGISPDQIVLFSDSLDDIIEADNPIRAIDIYVSMLDLGALGFKLPELKTGRSPYDPKILLKIYIYGFLEKIRSSRKLEKECKRNTEMIWLAQSLKPDHWTINNFLKTHKVFIKNIFYNFLIFCKNANLITLEKVGIDGSKFRAQNSKNNVHKKKKIEELENKIMLKIEEYVQELESNDSNEDEELRLERNKETQNKLESLKKYKKKVENVKDKFAQEPKLETYFATDEDARFQSDQGKINPGYNSQIAVDDKNKLIVVNHVVNKSNDLEMMTPMVDKVLDVKKDLKITNHTHSLLDAGYDSEKEIMNNLSKEGISIIVADKHEAEKRNKKRYGNKNPDKVPGKGYQARDFKYDKDKDVCICPEGKELHKTHTKPHLEKRTGRFMYEFLCHECDSCDKRDKCTKNKRGRSIKISSNRVILYEYKHRMQSKENKKLLSKRKEIVEHPFGTIKSNWGFRSFSRKGLENVQTEFNFICFIYNFRRVLNILGTQNFIKEIKRQKEAKKKQV